MKGFRLLALCCIVLMSATGLKADIGHFVINFYDWPGFQSFGGQANVETIPGDLILWCMGEGCYYYDPQMIVDDISASTPIYDLNFAFGPADEFGDGSFYGQNASGEHWDSLVITADLPGGLGGGTYTCDSNLFNECGFRFTEPLLEIFFYGGTGIDSVVVPEPASCVLFLTVAGVLLTRRALRRA